MEAFITELKHIVKDQRMFLKDYHAHPEKTKMIQDKWATFALKWKSFLSSLSTYERKQMFQDKVNHKIPFEIFEKWFDEATNNSKIVEPSAMCLATSNHENQPSSRMVLLKKFDERGFCFYTNLTSRKGQELKQNPNVALCFYWGILGRQVRIEGEIEPVSKAEADEYFASRRRESQIGAWASKQSQKMENWQEFENRISEIKTQFENQEVVF